jgi:hypothetical protein
MHLRFEGNSSLHQPLSFRHEGDGTGPKGGARRLTALDIRFASLGLDSEQLGHTAVSEGRPRSVKPPTIIAERVVFLHCT